MIGSDWYAGMRVVCINDGWGYFRAADGVTLPTRVPMLNEVLTISELKFGMSGLAWCPRPIDTEGVFLAFAEIPLKQQDGWLSMDLRWRADFFRPLEERKTDISIFTSMLTGAKERERA